MDKKNHHLEFLTHLPIEIAHNHHLISTSPLTTTLQHSFPCISFTQKHKPFSSDVTLPCHDLHLTSHTPFLSAVLTLFPAISTPHTAACCERLCRVCAHRDKEQGNNDGDARDTDGTRAGAGRPRGALRGAAQQRRTAHGRRDGGADRGRVHRPRARRHDRLRAAARRRHRPAHGRRARGRRRRPRAPHGAARWTRPPRPARAARRHRVALCRAPPGLDPPRQLRRLHRALLCPRTLLPRLCQVREPLLRRISICFEKVS